MDKLQEAGICFPQILIPEKKVNKHKWAVIACDQFTSNEDFWLRTQKIVGGAPSALHIIVPEAFIGMQDVPDRIAHAKQIMRNYIDDGVLVCLPEGLILVERETPSGTRIGIVLAIDLEQYDMDPSKYPLIRATEETVSERIPIRVALRQDAVIECPHAMLLINDPDDTVLGPVYNSKESLAKIYSAELMQGGGRIEGWFVEDNNMLEGIADALIKLKRKAKDNMLFAVGDGNHSLVSAKQIWDNHKINMDELQRAQSPLRYALVEIVNMYDPGINVYPIHRMLFNVDVPGALRSLVSILNKTGQQAHMMYTRGTKGYAKPGTQLINFVSKMSKGYIEVEKPQHELVSKTLTDALDILCEEMPRAKVDYIHDDEEFHSLAKEHAALGFSLDPIGKEDLFDMVIKYGVLPKKTFSLGSALEKRYYLECRLLVEAESAEDDEQAQAPDEEETLLEQNGEQEQYLTEYIEPESEQGPQDIEQEVQEDIDAKPRRGLRHKKTRKRRESK